MEQHFVEEPCQEGWHRPALSLFAKVFIVFSCTLLKVTCFQKFTFAKRCANASLPHGRQNRLTSPAKKNRKFPMGNSLSYLSCGFLQGASGRAHPVFVLSESACGLFFWRIIRFNTQHPVADPHMGLNQMQRMCA